MKIGNAQLKPLLHRGKPEQAAQIIEQQSSAISTPQQRKNEMIQQSHQHRYVFHQHYFPVSIKTGELNKIKTINHLTLNIDSLASLKQAVKNMSMLAAVHSLSLNLNFTPEAKPKAMLQVLRRLLNFCKRLEQLDVYVRGEFVELDANQQLIIFIALSRLARQASGKLKTLDLLFPLSSAVEPAKDFSLELLARFLPKYPQLQRLALNAPGSLSQDLILAAIIKKQPQLLKLSLRFSNLANLSATGARQDLFEDNQLIKLTVLELDFRPLSAGGNSIFDPLLRCNLTHFPLLKSLILRFCYCKIKDHDLRLLAGFLRANKQLTQLSLDLTGNYDLSNEGLSCLLASLTRTDFSSLSLNFEYTAITKDWLKLLANFLIKQNHLTQLELAFNPLILSCSGLVVLTAVLVELPLNEFKLKFFDSDVDRVLTTLNTYLPSFPQLKTFHLTLAAASLNSSELLGLATTLVELPLLQNLVISFILGSAEFDGSILAKMLSLLIGFGQLNRLVFSFKDGNMPDSCLSKALEEITPTLTKYKEDGLAGAKLVEFDFNDLWGYPLKQSDEPQLNQAGNIQLVDSLSDDFSVEGSVEYALLNNSYNDLLADNSNTLLKFEEALQEYNKSQKVKISAKNFCRFFSKV